jgi:gliding motility-associated protein GldE
LILQIATISLGIIIFGKLLPKVFAYNKVIGFTLFSANILFIAQKFFKPLSHILISSTTIINRILLKTKGNLSITELSEALDQDKDVVTEDRKILMGIVNFSNIEVSEIMKPRMDVIAVDISTDFEKLIHVINDSGYSRIPVFIETFDNIKGILYVKDLLPYLGKNDNFQWQDLIRPGYYVPETKKIKDLLQEFLDKKIHMAVVVDEYGGTEGIVTLEDILEEIVGEITDETDEVESFYSKIDEDNFIFDAKILLNDFFKIVQLSEELFDDVRGEADTLAGLILEIKGSIPPVNEVIILKNFTFTILSVDERRIKKVKFTINKSFKNRGDRAWN